MEIRFDRKPAKIYREPAHNIQCNFRFTCGASECPDPTPKSQNNQPPECHIDKYERYQPDSEDKSWHEKSWKDVNKITWLEVLSFQEYKFYIIILITLIVFSFIVIVLMKVVFDINILNIDIYQIFEPYKNISNDIFNKSVNKNTT